MSWQPGSWQPSGWLPTGWLPGDPGSGSSSSSGLAGADYGTPDYVKAPDEIVRIEFPWASKLDGETIQSTAYELPDGLTNQGEVGTGTLRSVLVSGGQDRLIYRVIARVVTNESRQLTWVKRVLVMEG